jgi:hypothetical protein
MQRVIFRFRRPTGSVQSHPSEALHEALMLLSEAEELQPLYCEATKAGKRVAIELFQSRDGDPILIHFGKESVTNVINDTLLP